DANAIDRAASTAVSELWFNARPILLEVGLPALLMGFSFPLANSIIQRAEDSVGRRAGVLYLANACGAVCGSLAAGVVLLPALGIQTSVTILAVFAGLAVVPLYVVQSRPSVATWIGPLVASVAVGLWLFLPAAYVITRAAPPAKGEQLIAVSEGLTEVITVMETPGKGRTL